MNKDEDYSYVVIESWGDMTFVMGPYTWEEANEFVSSHRHLHVKHEVKVDYQ